jgi:hypothetical protein
VTRLLDNDFETGSVAPTGWATGGTAPVISTSVFAHGANAMQIPWSASAARYLQTSSSSIGGANPTDTFSRFYFRYAATPAAATFIFATFGGSQSNYLRLNTNGTLTIRSNTTDKVTGTTVLSAGTWYCIEVRTRVGTTTSNGQWEVRVDGVAEISNSTMNMGTSTSTYRIYFGSTSAVNPNTTFYWDDLAINSSAGSAPDNTWVGLISAPSAPDAPVLTATPGDGQVSLEWTAVDGAVGYTVYRDDVDVHETTDTEWVDTGLTNGVEYDYYVTANDGTLESDPSNIESVTPEAPPTPPTGVVVDNFARADQSPISGDWQSNPSGLGATRLVSNALASTSTSGEAVYAVPMSGASKVAMGVTLSVAGDFYVGVTNTRSDLVGYVGGYDGLYRFDASDDFTQLDDTAVTPEDGDQYWVTYDPSNGRVEFWQLRDATWALISSATDTTYAATSLWYSWLGPWDTPTRMVDFAQLAPTGTYETTVLAESGLVAYWPLEDSAFPMVEETAAGGIASMAVLAGSPAAGADPVIEGGASAVTVPSGAYLRAPGSAFSYPTHATIEFWVRVESFGSTTIFVSVFGTLEDPDDVISFYVAMDSTGHVRGEDSLLIDSSALETGVNHHVVYTGNVDTSTRALYVDGVLVDSDTGFFPVAYTATSFRIGATSAHEEFVIGHLAVYDEVLDASTIQAHYFAGVGAVTVDKDGGVSGAGSVGGTSSVPGPVDKTGGVGGVASLGGTATSGAVGYNGFSSAAGILPDETWRPFSDDSPWNIGDVQRRKKHPNSDTYVSAFLAAADIAEGTDTFDVSRITVNWAGHDVFHPIYWAALSDPLYTTDRSSGTDEADGLSIRMPQGAMPGDGVDGHLTVIAPDGSGVDLWQAVVNHTTHTISYSIGRLFEVDGNGTDGGGTAAGFPCLAGQVRAAELEAGEINHALFITSIVGANDTDTSFGFGTVAGSGDGSHVYPADSGDAEQSALSGSSGHTWPPMGCWVRINLTESQVNALSIPAWEKAILHALRVYGAYFGDTGGSGFGVFQFESSQMYTSMGLDDPYLDYANAHATGQDISDSGGVKIFDPNNANIDWASILEVVLPPNWYVFDDVGVSGAGSMGGTHQVDFGLTVDKTGGPSGSASMAAATEVEVDTGGGITGTGASGGAEAIVVVRSGGVSGGGSVGGANAAQLARSGGVAGAGSMGGTHAIEVAASGGPAGTSAVAGTRTVEVERDTGVVGEGAIGATSQVAQAFDVSGGAEGAGSLGADRALDVLLEGGVEATGALGGASSTSLANGKTGGLHAAAAMAGTHIVEVDLDGGVEGEGVIGGSLVGSQVIDAEGGVEGTGALGGTATHDVIKGGGVEGAAATGGARAVEVDLDGGMASFPQLGADSVFEVARAGGVLGDGATSGTRTVEFADEVGPSGEGSLGGDSDTPLSQRGGPSGEASLGAARTVEADVTGGASAAGAMGATTRVLVDKAGGPAGAAALGGTSGRALDKTGGPAGAGAMSATRMIEVVRSGGTSAQGSIGMSPRHLTVDKDGGVHAGAQLAGANTLVRSLGGGPVGNVTLGASHTVQVVKAAGVIATGSLSGHTGGDESGLSTSVSLGGAHEVTNIYWFVRSGGIGAHARMAEVFGGVIPDVAGVLRVVWPDNRHETSYADNSHQVEYADNTHQVEYD